MKISVILSTVNRHEILNKTLESFSRADLTGLDVQFIVVDNGSTDKTETVIKRWQSLLPLLHLFESRPGKNVCLNKALEQAHGECFVFTDDDVIADQRWLVEMCEAAGRWPDESLFGGRIAPKFPEGTEEWLKEISAKHPVIFSEFQLDSPEGPVNPVPVGPNLMIRASVFDDFRYDETIGPSGKSYAMGSETEFLVRVKLALGCNYIYLPNAKVEHIIRPEQIEWSWILGRGHRAGRGLARAIQTNRLRIAGAPWTIWLRYLKSRLSLLGKEDNFSAETFDSHWQYQKNLGCIFEYRNGQVD